MSVVDEGPVVVRISRFYSLPDRVEQLTAAYVERVAPALGERPGCRETTLLVNRRTGRGASMTSWTNESALSGSEQAASTAEAQAVRTADGWLLRIERYDVVAREQRVGPALNVFVRLADAQTSPDTLDETLTFLTQRVVPALRAQPGFRAALVGCNREAGRVLLMSNWTSLLDMRASEAATADLRQRSALLAGVESVATEPYEVVVTQSYGSS